MEHIEISSEIEREEYIRKISNIEEGFSLALPELEESYLNLNNIFGLENMNKGKRETVSDDQNLCFGDLITIERQNPISNGCVRLCSFCRAYNLIKFRPILEGTNRQYIYIYM